MVEPNRVFIDDIICEVKGQPSLTATGNLYIVYSCFNEKTDKIYDYIDIEADIPGRMIEDIKSQLKDIIESINKED